VAGFKVKLGHNGTIAPREGFVRLVNNQPTEGSLLVDMTTLKTPIRKER
jgi:hypothetical protein